MVRIADLYALQEVDSQIDSLQRTLDEIRGRETESEELRLAAERLLALGEQRHEIESEQRQIGYDVEDLRAQATDVEAKLYGGTVTSSRELKDLQRELESIQRRQHEKEEALLGVMSRLEETQAEAATTSSGLAEGRAAWEREQSEAQVRAAEIEQELEALQSRRTAALRPVDANSLVLYERLRKTRGGRAVARVDRGACLGCRIMLPSNLFQKARSGAMVVQCSSCERILFVA
jgi:predicted  nucleic acid-binding Zn-ribbon protein